MAYSPVTYTGDGTTTTFAVPFPFLNRADITVTLDDTQTTAFSWASSGSITFKVAPAAGVEINIERSTPTTSVANFTAGNLRSKDLNRALLQTLYLYEELLIIAYNDLVAAQAAAAAAEAAAAAAAALVGGAGLTAPSLTSIIAGLPTTLPANSGVLWLNNGVPELS